MLEAGQQQGVICYTPHCKADKPPQSDNKQSFSSIAYEVDLSYGTCL